eukprot:scaffold4501_cov395-Prasinococcus_capsulatus_cf.AAC.4
MLLRIDDIVSGMKKKQAHAGAQPQSMWMPGAAHSANANVDLLLLHQNPRSRRREQARRMHYRNRLQVCVLGMAGGLPLGSLPSRVRLLVMRGGGSRGLRSTGSSLLQMLAKCVLANRGLRPI